MNSDIESLLNSILEDVKEEKYNQWNETIESFLKKMKMDFSVLNEEQEEKTKNNKNDNQKNEEEKAILIFKKMRENRLSGNYVVYTYTCMLLYKTKVDFCIRKTNDLQ